MTRAQVYKTSRSVKKRAAEFDIDALSNDQLRARYQSLRKRFTDAARSAEDGYGLGGQKISFRFIYSDRFNAYCRIDQDGYEVDIATAIPVLTLLFFDQLFSCPRIMKWLPGGDNDAVSYDVQFSSGPHDLTSIKDWSIKTSPLRAYVAYMASEIASTFVLMHELGHILCGHLQARDAIYGDPFIAEFSYFAESTAEDFELNQLFEYEADAAAAWLITQYVDELVEATNEDERAQEAFGCGGHAAERSVAFCVIVLYALFAYLRALKSRLSLQSSHPDPLVRAFYVRDMIWKVAKERHALDDEVVGEMLEDLFEEVNLELVGLGLQSEEQFQQDSDFEQIDLDVERLKASKTKYRELSRKFSFVTWG